MSKEREFLKKLRYASLLENDLRKELDELLAQPEQEIYAKGYAEAMKQQVYEAYESGRKSALTEQEPVAWMYEWVNEIGEHVKSVVYNFYDDANLIPLYTAPPKREPLTGIEISQGFQADDAAREGEDDEL